MTGVPMADHLSTDLHEATDPRLSGILTSAGHALRVRVYFEDTDFSGAVYHASYLRFLERGRSDFLRLLGVHHTVLAADSLVFAVRRMAIEFDRPARIDDVVEVRTSVEELGGASVTLRQEIGRGADLLVRATVTVALLSLDGRVKRFPASIRQALTGRSQPLR
jgi:acyl-CoA thioester hydrolase